MRADSDAYVVQEALYEQEVIALQYQEELLACHT